MRSSVLNMHEGFSLDFTVNDFMVRLILKSCSIANSPTMAEQERVTD